MKRFFLSESAKADLHSIAEFWMEVSERTATRNMKAIEERCQRLASNPGIGRARPEFGPNYRSFAVEDHVIFFFPIRNGVEILRILHGARNISIKDFQ